MRSLEDAGKNGKFHHHDGSGRPMATEDHEHRLIVRSATTAPDSSLSTIRCVTRTRVSTMTIHRRLTERNLCSYRPLRKVRITPAYCQVRLQWYLSVTGWNHADWGRIGFSNEFSFQLCPDKHRRRIWRRPGQRADPASTISGFQAPQALNMGL
ncbi:HTH_Tnp_Tc3_2 domain-containing protein [Trichonephila clavipes]|nr:HTH_Tnp_Tc3_2 domain-containing protein [Trichonephila clavipes]